MRNLKYVFCLCVALGLVVVSSQSLFAYQEIVVSDGGTIKGKVVYHGAIPERQVIPTKNVDVCGKMRMDPMIARGHDDSVKDAIVYLERIDKGKPLPKVAKEPELNNRKCRFVPDVQVVHKGDIDIVNSDPHLHNTHGFLGRKTEFNVSLPFEGMRIKRPLRDTGLIHVKCDAHGWMLGWIYVTDNPYYAITNEKGEFTITDVPPGSYNLVTWAQYMGEKNRMETPVTVGSKKTTSIDIELQKSLWDQNL